MLISYVKDMEITCAKCGVIFYSKQGNAKRCEACRNSNAARAQTRADYVPHFIGVDGEGVNDPDAPGGHKYVLLSVGDRSLHRDGAHLSFLEILEFLWECFADDEEAVYCGYYLKYDFEQWFRTLPEDRAAILHNPGRRARTASGGNLTPFPVYFEGWEFDTLGLKRFKLRREGSKKWMHICDVGGFFQQPFATAILGWQDKHGNPIEIVTPEELEIIEEGKANRATAKFNKAMIRYNCAENRVLARMMAVLASGFKEGMDVRLLRDQWYGPGQVAQKWMDAHSSHAAKILKKKAETDEVFRGALDASKNCYYGGWFETYAHGHIRGTSWEYDIASAYPHVHSQLPCLLHGKWKHVSGNEPNEFSKWTLVRADVEGDNPYIGAMLHRDKKGRINRPNYTSGWYWKHELDAAKKASLICSLAIHEAYVYEPCACAPPLAKLRDLFALRLAVGKSTPQGRGLKLGYNSCYGKTAQSIGTPKHANPIHASLITAGCRTMILEAIASHPDGAKAVLMIATDGIYFASRHPHLKLGHNLGDWEETKKENLTIFLPGVYWDDVSRASRSAKAAKLKSRGVSANDLIARIDALDAGFSKMLNEPIPWRMFEGDVSPEWWLKLQLPIRFSMVSSKQAIQRGKWETAGAVSSEGIRELWACPRHKRERVFAPSADRPFISTGVPQNRARIAATPYNKNFGMELSERQTEDYILTPEGDAMDEAYALIRGE